MLTSTFVRFVLIAALALPVSCGGERCTGGGTCACPPEYCPDLVTTAKDSGKTFRMAVGEWVSLELPGGAVSATASSSDPTVVTVAGTTKSAYVKFQKVVASFHALRSGWASLKFGYLTCDTTTPDPCSNGVEVHVVQFPKTSVTVDNIFEHGTVKLRVGEIARFSAPFANDASWKEVTIDAPEVLRWAVEPIYLSHSLFEAAVAGVSPGAAHVQGYACSAPDPVCSRPWRLTVEVN